MQDELKKLMELVGKKAIDKDGNQRTITGIHVYFGEQGIMSVKVHLSCDPEYYRLQELKIAD